MLSKNGVIDAIDVFGGVGGFRLGLTQAFGDKIKFAWGCENDKYARRVYKHRFGEWPAGDVREVDTGDIPDHDLLCAGFPCQPFSVAGSRKGFKDTRGTLFYEICRILRDKQPPMVLLENVRGLLSADGYRSFRIIIESLRDLGYVGQYQIINSKYWVPQNRQRVYIIGYLGEGCRREIFPLGQDGGVPTKEVRTDGGVVETDICSIVTQKLRETDTFVVEGNGDTDYIIKRHRKDEIRDHGDTCPTLTESHDHHGGANLPMLVIHNLQQRSEKRPSVAADKNAGGAGPLSKCDGTTYCVEGANLQAVEVKSGLRHARGFETRDDDISHCLKGAEGGSSQVHLYIQNIPHGHNTGWKKELPNLRAHKGAPYNELLVQGTRIRRLTPKERERLQGFPDGFTKWGIDEKTGEKVGISDSQRYKMLGNAVTVPVVKAIGRRLMEECNP